MSLSVKEITNFVENDTKKTKLVIVEDGKETEVIFTGDGILKTAVEV